MDLFRKEVFDDLAQRSTGTILVSRDVGLTRLVAGAICASIVLLSFLWFATYTRRLHVVGMVVAATPPTMVATPSSGTVRRVFVQGSQLVDADEALAEVETFPQDSIPSAGQLETISSSATIGHDKTRLSSITSTLRSAEPGWVTMCVNLGESVALGQVVAVKQPTSFKLVGLVRLSEEQLGHVRIGKKLLVRYPAYPVKEYGSHSATIDAVFASQRDGPSNGCPRENRISDKAAFDVRLSLDEPPTSTTEPIVLREGMTFEAELPIEKVRLLRLVLEPLLQEK